MTATDAVLASADGAVRDWETSSDAMRWRPDRAVPVAPEVPPVTIDFATLNRGLSQMHAAFTKMASDFGKALQPFGRILARMGHDLDAENHPRAHVRCRTCHPCANPGPMLGVKPSLRSQRAHRQRKRRKR